MSAAISASQVKELRDKTSAGMMECKKALAEAEGDLEKAVKILRERGIAKGEKRAGRTAAEGLVSIDTNADQTAAGIAELNCETDFVARNEEFQAVVAASSKKALEVKATGVADVLSQKLDGFNRTADEIVQDLLAKIGEKILLNRAECVSGDVVAGYIHPPGKIGVVVAAKLSDGAKATEDLVETLRGVAMHIAAFGPRFLDRSQVDTSTMEAERDIFTNIARQEGKPENLIPKIVEGRLSTFFKENCLVDQVYAKDGKQTVGNIVKEAGKKAGGTVEITRFVRYKVGETAEPAAAEE